jgi:hypothetical protein
VTRHSPPGLCLFAISNARSMLSACTVTLKRAAPLLTSTETLTISLPRFRAETVLVPSGPLHPGSRFDTLKDFSYNSITKA